MSQNSHKDEACSKAAMGFVIMLLCQWIVLSIIMSESSSPTGFKTRRARGLVPSHCCYMHDARKQATYEDWSLNQLLLWKMLMISIHQSVFSSHRVSGLNTARISIDPKLASSKWLNSGKLLSTWLTLIHWDNKLKQAIASMLPSFPRFWPQICFSCLFSRWAQ